MQYARFLGRALQGDFGLSLRYNQPALPLVLASLPATLELLSVAQAELIDSVEVGERVAGPVRLALEVADSAATARKLVAAGAEALADPVLTPWNDLNVRLRAQGGLQLTLFTPSKPAE